MYGIGTTHGTGTTDRIDGGVAITLSGAITIVIGAYRQGAGGGNLGTMVDQRVAGTRYVTVQHDSVGATYGMTRNYSGNVNANWTVPAPSATTDHVICICQDGALTTAPTIDIDGTSQTVSTGSAATGTAAGASGVPSVGNRSSDGARNWNGKLYRFAAWSRILNSTERTQIGAGYSPLCFPSGLLDYFELGNGLTSFVGTSASLAAGTPLLLTHTPALIHPVGNGLTDTQRMSRLERFAA